ncbi:hypothetical protein MK528_11500, partial [Streptococcus gordonii]|nr:hypothetical protein [Streptococcus gordonii]
GESPQRGIYSQGARDLGLFCMVCRDERVGIENLIYQVNIPRVAHLTDLYLLGQGLKFLTLLSTIPM